MLPASWKIGRPLRRGRARWRALWILPEARRRSADTAEFQFDGQEEAFAEACRRLGVTRRGEFRRSYRGKSIGAEIETRAGEARWLKVDGVRGAPDSWRRSGELMAEAFAGIPKPSAIRRTVWPDGDVHWLAVEMTLAPSPTVADRPWLMPPFPTISEDWIVDLKRALNRVASLPLGRSRIDRGQIDLLIKRRLGARAPRSVEEWRTAHGDLNWSNLTAPHLSLLDWELWGTAPRGFDVANLLSLSAGDPALFRRIEAAFAGDLETPSGLVARLFCFAARLEGIERGATDFTEHRWLEAETERLLRR